MAILDNIRQYLKEKFKLRESNTTTLNLPKDCRVIKLRYYEAISRPSQIYPHLKLYEISNCPFQEYKIPDQLTLEESLKLLSYLSRLGEKENGRDRLSIHNARYIIEHIEELGFVNVNASNDDFLPLFIVNGDFEHFKNTKYYNDYFEWFTKVSRKEFNDIISKIEPIESPQQLS